MAGDEYSDGGEADAGIVEELLRIAMVSVVCFEMRGGSSAREAGLRDMSISIIRSADAVAASRVWKVSGLGTEESPLQAVEHCSLSTRYIYQKGSLAKYIRS